MAEEKKPEELYAAVLLPDSLGYRTYRHNDPHDYTRLAFYDGSSLPFMVEELISQGATFLAVDGSSPYFAAVDKLPEVFRRRVLKIDKDGKAITRMHAILSPILEELDVKFTPPTFLDGHGLTTLAGHAVSSLCTRDIRNFVLGIEYELQIDINLPRIRENLAILDRHVRSSEARAHLAMLKQIFGAYESREVRELGLLLPASPIQRLEAFLTFVEQAEYRQLSKERRLFGFPALLHKAIAKFDHLIDSLSGTPSSRSLVSIATKQIELATKIPMPDEKLLESLEFRPYLPPIISLEESKARAKANWRLARPPFIPLEKNATGDLIADDDHPHPLQRD
jgi:hypothetical protein